MLILIEAFYVLLTSFIVGVLAGYSGHPWVTVIIGSILVSVGFLQMERLLDKVAIWLDRKGGEE